MDFVRVLVRKAQKRGCKPKMLRRLRLSFSVNHFHVTPMNPRNKQACQASTPTMPQMPTSFNEGV
jgi:hypothetical protein